MFWSLILEPGRKYSSIVEDAFHVSMAAVSLKTVKNEKEVYPVYCKVDDREDLVLCNLSKTGFPQHSLDLNFENGSKVDFYTTGSATIHLTGYLMNELPNYDDESDLDSDESVDSIDEAPKKKGQGDEKSSQKKKRKSEVEIDTVAKKKTKSKSGEEDGSKNGLDMRMTTLNDSKGSDSDEDDSDDDDMDDDSDLTGSDLDSPSDDASLDDFDDVDDDDEDDDDDDSDVESDDSSDRVTPQKTPQHTPKKKADEKTPKQGKTPQNQTPKQGKIPQNQTPKQGKTPQNQTPKQGKTPQNQTPASNKKQSQQLQNGATPKSDKKATNKDTPQPKQGGKDTPQKQGGSPKKQTLAGGVQIEELKSGRGPVAKPGKMVGVFYTGRLKSNNRVFDQAQSGAGFKFRLGKGEVIKGWDVGVAGMTVGSKRRITCPASMAYGSKGSGPQIPPNATLVFDVELKSVN